MNSNTNANTNTLQLADIGDVAAGAAWAEISDDSASDSDSHTRNQYPFFAYGDATNSSKSATKTETKNGINNARVAAVFVHSGHPPLPSATTTASASDHILLLNENAVLSSVAVGTTRDSGKPISLSLSSFESKFKEIALDEDALVSASQFVIESTISKLTQLKASLQNWDLEKRILIAEHGGFFSYDNASNGKTISNSGSDRKSTGSNGGSNSDHSSIINSGESVSLSNLNQLNPRTSSLLSNIDFSISLCEQFRSINADSLRVENILHEDESSNIISRPSSIINPMDLIPDVNEVALSLAPKNIPTNAYLMGNSVNRSSIISASSFSRPTTPQFHRSSIISTFETASIADISRSPSVLSSNIPNHYFSAIPNPVGRADFFKWTMLRNLTNDLHSDSTKLEYGIPTAFSVSSFIAVGTSKAMILIYDLTQVLKSVIGDIKSFTKMGAVISIAVSFDHSKVAAGYASGTIAVWDVAKRQAVKIINPIEREVEVTTALKRGHLLNSKIIHIAFVGSKTDLISADDEGLAFYHAIASLMSFSAITSTQLAGNQPIYTLQPLPRAQRPHYTDQVRIVAVTTPFRLTLMRLKPTPAVLFKMQLQKEVGENVCGGVTCAAIGWRPALFSVHGGNTLSDPALAASFGKKLIVFVMLNPDTSSRDKLKAQLSIKKLGSWTCDESIVGIHWINFNLLGLMTNQENLIVLDTVRMVELERCSVKSQSIIQHDYFSKELKEFGIIPEMAYFSNFRSYKGRIFIMGINGLYVGSLMTWSDRVTNLVKTGDYKGAIEMASGFYSGSVIKAVSGLPNDDEGREKVVGSLLSEIISTYVETVLSNVDFEMSSQDLAFVRDLAGTSFSTCLMIRNEDLLLGEIYDLFSEAGVSHLFLEEMEDYLLKEKLSVRLNRPGIIQALVSFFSSQGWYSRLEQLLIHIDPSAMDINQILRLCEDHVMYSALIFIHNNAMRDFVSPLVALLTQLDSAMRTNSKEKLRETSENGYIVYVYLAYILTGKAFPSGNLTRKDALQAKSDLYNFLFSASYSFWPPSDTPAVSAENYRAIGCEPFPYVRLLIQHDAREFFGVLTVAFEDGSLEGEIRLRDGHAQDGRVRFADMYSEFNRQFVVDTMLVLSHTEIPSVNEVKKGGDSLIDGHLSESDLVQLNIFVAKAFVKYGTDGGSGNFNNAVFARGGGSRDKVGQSGEISPPEVQISQQSSNEIFQKLLLSTDAKSRDEREAALLALLVVYNPAKSNSERESLLRNCEKAGFWKVAEQLYKRAGQFEMVVQCYLNDSNRRGDVFSFLTEILVQGQGGLEYSQTYSLKQHLLDMLPQLLNIDSVQTVALIIAIYSNEQSQIIQGLQYKPRSQYIFLKGLLEFEFLETSNSRAALTGSKRSQSILNLRSKYLSSGLQFRGHTHSKYFSRDSYNLLIQLMLEFEPASVLQFLIDTAKHCDECQDNQDPYDFETVLSSCLDLGVKKPGLWMLERTGQVGRAIDIVLQDFEKLAIACVNLFQSDGVGARSPENVIGVYSNPFAQRNDVIAQSQTVFNQNLQEMVAQFEIALSICQRKSSNLDKWESDSIWFRLLDAVLDRHNELRTIIVTPCYDIVEVEDGSRTPTVNQNNTSSKLVYSFRTMLRKIVGSMILRVDLPSILTHLLHSIDNVRFGELRQTIFVMLEEYSFESQLYSTVNRILSKDAHNLNINLVKKHHKGLLPMKGQCGVCRRLLHIQTAAKRQDDISDHLVVFECRHVFHEHCLKEEINLGNPQISIDESDYWCVVCEVMNENCAREFKRNIIERIKANTGKGKRPEIQVKDEIQKHIFTRFETNTSNFERVIELLDLTPSPAEILDTFASTGEIDDDHISLNESFDDTESFSTALTMSYGTNRIPKKVLRLVEKTTDRFSLRLQHE
ncbi:Vacuolar protein sorting-associated protein 8 [Physocladia obscura]|uniref:Vacuolar protein sorting-associated protein 8 n=1 Tax=Physocladia obscura TaxID=109957 RepID=A0AAD5T7U5_9FUNG|nr:Vacuolar protein sorting-associated protein 8 [Physocladia obscura]